MLLNFCSIAPCSPSAIISDRKNVYNRSGFQAEAGVFRRLALTAVAALVASVAALYVFSGTVSAQFAASQAAQSRVEKEMLERQIKEANKKRQEDIRKDTDKLLELATELKAAVDKTNENLLSIDVVRKADEVEHLAHRVKEKMKEAVGAPPQKEPIVVPRPQ
jgi:HAMP domain-containing protein